MAGWLLSGSSWTYIIKEHLNVVIVLVYFYDIERFDIITNNL